MSEKRNWFSKICIDSQEAKTDLEISWTNSDSDKDLEDPQVTDRMKTIENTKSNHWLYLEVTPKKNKPQLEVAEVCPIQTFPDEFVESPIITGCKREEQIEEQSPILSQTYVSLLKEKSPVIGRNKVTRKLRWLHKRKKKKAKLQDELIIESPPESSPEKEPVISPVKSEFSQPYTIDPFPSQHSSEVVSDFLSNFSDNKVASNHHHPRKKRFKKGTLASQLQKAIDLQSASAAIWQHEMFLGKSKEEQIHQSDVSEGVEFNFLVKNKWEEYGCLVIENLPDATLLESFSKEVDNMETFLLITSPTNSSNVCFDNEKSYRIFPPYNTKVVNFQFKKTLCIINASRFISL